MNDVESERERKFTDDAKQTDTIDFKAAPSQLTDEFSVHDCPSLAAVRTKTSPITSNRYVNESNPAAIRPLFTRHLHNSATGARTRRLQRRDGFSEEIVLLAPTREAPMPPARPVSRPELSPVCVNSI